MVDINEFLSLLLSIYKETGIKTINVNDIKEIIKILYSSSDFLEYSNKLKIKEFNFETIVNHPFCENIDENGEIEYKVNEKVRNKLLERKKSDTLHLRNAINKYLLGKVYNIASGGLIELSYDDPDGEYTLPFLDNPMLELETNLYTDGNIIEESLENDIQYSKVRTIKVENSTYTIMVDNERKMQTGMQVRALAIRDYSMILNEATMILKKDIGNYNVISKDKPRTYKFRRN